MRLLTRSRGVALAAALAAGLVAAPAAASAAEPKDEADRVHEARTKLFGPGWDTPGVVRMRPAVANTTVLASYGGTVIVHDATIENDLTDIQEEDDNNGFIGLQDVIDAKPAAILQDHTHFDQQHHAVEIASSGVPLVTDVGGCFFTKETAIEKGVDPAEIECNLVRDENGKAFLADDTFFAAGGVIPREATGGLLTPYGTKGWPSEPIPGIDVMALELKHSPSFSNRPYPNRLSGPDFQPLRNLQDLQDSYEGATPSDIANDQISTFRPFDLEGSNIGYLVQYDGFSVLHHGSTGETNSLETGAKEISEALRSLREEEHVDLEIGGVAEVTYFTNGAGSQNNQQYWKDIGAKLFMPTHHYNWYPTFFMTNPAVTYYQEMTEAMAVSTSEAEAEGYPLPEMCYLTEDNYATVVSFDADEWEGSDVGTMDVVEGPGCYTG